MVLATWLISFLFTALPPTPTYTGFWLTADQDAVIEISRQVDGYVGRYVAFRRDPAAKKARLNTYSFKEMKVDGDELSGKVIDPKSGKDYKATLHLTGVQTLEMKVKMMGVTAHTETWTRQPAGK